MRVGSSPVPPGWRWLVLATALFCLSCSGGGDRLNPVSGKVTYKKQPLKGATVTFHPQGAMTKQTHPSVGLTDENGEFTLRTGKKTGAPAGQYVITVICSATVDKKGKGAISTEPPDAKDILGGAYADVKTSTIKREVKAGTNQIDPIDLN
jgi:hypothetical protein